MHPPLIPGDLVLVRHAPVETPGRLCGRADVAAKLPPPEALMALRAFLAPAAVRITSPALRCRQTADAIWQDRADLREEATLWEQDFGDWDGALYADLPDIGALEGDALAAHRPPNGESIDDLCVRAIPTLQGIAGQGQGPTVIVAHAGIVRAALALAIGSNPAALRFSVAHLSVTRFACTPTGDLSIKSVNVPLVDLT